MGSSNAALHGGFFGLEYKVYMYRAKRNFINRKYGYIHNEPVLKNISHLANAAPCVNEDFEASPTGSVMSVSGWTISEGSNTSSCSMGGCCANAATGLNTWIRTTPFISPGPVSINIPNSPLGGSKVIQMNNEVISSGEIVRLEQVFPVTSTNVILEYAYMCMLDGSGHSCCDLPYMNILVYDCSNNLIPSASTSVVATGSSCVGATTGWSVTTGGVNYFANWQVKTVNLSAYIGSCIKIQVTVGDCTGWAHAGYGYFDAKCSGSTGIENTVLNEKKVKIYPNPNNGEFTITALGEDIICIINELGQVVKTITLCANNNYSSTINGLANGIYFAIGKNFREKIVVMK